MSRRTGRPSYAQPRASAAGLPAVGVALALVVVSVLAGAVGWWIGQPDPTQQGVAQLRAEETRRDVEQIRTLTEQARTTRTEVEPVLAELNAALTGTAGVSPDQVRAWQQATGAAVRRHAEAPSGTTATNVARGALRTAVDGFGVAVDTYAAVASLPEPQRQPMLDLIGRQLAAATAAWSIAAAQLDQINIDAGLGHQHVHLNGEAPPDGSVEGQPGG